MGRRTVNASDVRRLCGMPPLIGGKLGSICHKKCAACFFAASERLVGWVQAVGRDRYQILDSHRRLVARKFDDKTFNALGVFAGARRQGVENSGPEFEALRGREASSPALSTGYLLAWVSWRSCSCIFLFSTELGKTAMALIVSRSVSEYVAYPFLASSSIARWAPRYFTNPLRWPR